MSIVLPFSAYGNRTEALQDIISNAERLLLFDSFVGEPVSAEMQMLVAEHLRLMTASGVPVPDVVGHRVLEGPVRTLIGDWTIKGDRWRDAVAAVIVGMRTRYEQEPYRQRLKPPIWPHKGTANIIGRLLIATEGTHRRCQLVARDREEFEQAWIVAGTIEKWVDALLLGELFGDVDQTNALRPIFRLCQMGMVPLGWDDGIFWLYRFSRENQ